jgi:hypothetical protein
MEGGLQVAVQLDPKVKEEAIEVAREFWSSCSDSRGHKHVHDLLTKPYFEF